jgi:hypothetical protein
MLLCILDEFITLGVGRIALESDTEGGVDLICGVSTCFGNAFRKVLGHRERELVIKLCERLQRCDGLCAAVHKHGRVRAVHGGHPRLLLTSHNETIN